MFCVLIQEIEKQKMLIVNLSEIKKKIIDTKLVLLFFVKIFIVNNSKTELMLLQLNMYAFKV